MTDILLTPGGDLHISEWGDISLTESTRQAVKVRLQWFFDEWRFAPEFGVPYFEEILIKNPDTERIKLLVRDAAMLVDGVTDARNITVVINEPERSAAITLDIVTDEETYREEVFIYA